MKRTGGGKHKGVPGDERMGWVTTGGKKEWQNIGRQNAVLGLYPPARIYQTGSFLQSDAAI